MSGILEMVKYDGQGLVPAIAQDYITGRVLMLAYMNAETLKMTLESGYATYWSRSRQEIWIKGNTSGNRQKVKEIYFDCDQDAILMEIEQIGGIACHTGNASCFFRKADGQSLKEEKGPEPFFNAQILQEVARTIQDRKDNPKEGSYTNYLFDKGLDKILKKVGEETAEVIIAAKNKDKEEITYEISDLMYHLMVLMNERGVCWEDIFHELTKRK